MLIGLDFDNTIVCYDKAIARLADELFELPSDLPRTKLALRNFLRQAGRESEWTTFQGKLYGQGMDYAGPFEQSLETMRRLKHLGHSLCIISHRSLFPYAGPPYNLHAAARRWIEEVLASKDLVSNPQTFFYETRVQKISAIRTLGCKIFLDDLPEVLSDKIFPRDCQPVLFDPEDSYAELKIVRIVRWAELPQVLQAFQ